MDKNVLILFTVIILIYLIVTNIRLNRVYKKYNKLYNLLLIQDDLIDAEPTFENKDFREDKKTKIFVISAFILASINILCMIGFALNDD